MSAPLETAEAQAAADMVAEGAPIFPRDPTCPEPAPAPTADRPPQITIQNVSTSIRGAQFNHETRAAIEALANAAKANAEAIGKIADVAQKIGSVEGAMGISIDCSKREIERNPFDTRSAS